MHAHPGHFYAVGIGPGAPDLLTVRAVRIIESADIILAPQAKGTNRSLALKTIEPYLNKQEVMTVSYPMQRNGTGTQQRWDAVALDIRERLQLGRSVAMVTIGDPLIFATTSYLLYGLADVVDHDKIHLVPGISAFQIAASRFHDPLTLQEDRLTLMSATDLEAVENALEHCETLVLYKAAGVIDRLLDLLERRGLAHRRGRVDRHQRAGQLRRTRQWRAAGGQPDRLDADRVELYDDADCAGRQAGLGGVIRCSIALNLLRSGCVTRETKVKNQNRHPSPFAAAGAGQGFRGDLPRGCATPRPSGKDSLPYCSLFSNQFPHQKLANI